MILLISIQQPDINSLVNERFGRATWFIRYDTETQNWQALENPGWNNRGGAGVATAQFAADQNANAVISGEFGPNAVSALQAAGIQMLRFPQSGLTGAAVVELFRQGELSA
jgi:predicted Fe-Mo cluster-binding NifX family protein